MGALKPHDYDPELWDDQEHNANFERLRNQERKAPTVKGDRRQRDKEWGKAHAKWTKANKRLKP